MTVLVAIPFWRCGPHVAKAVESVLAQTHRDLVVMVAGDGDDPEPHLRGIDDPRLVVVAFPDNLGAPHTQQAMLLGSPHEWYAPMGADDWLDRDYLARLLALGGDANSVGAWYRHQGRRVEVRRTSVEVGVYRSELIRSLGGYGVTMRCSQDVLLYWRLTAAVTERRMLAHPAYHRLIRPGESLTRSRATGHGSAYRQAAAAHNEAVFARCMEIGVGDLAGIRAYRESLVPTDLAEALAARVDVVRSALDNT